LQANILSSFRSFFSIERGGERQVGEDKGILIPIGAVSNHFKSQKKTKIKQLHLSDIGNSSFPWMSQVLLQLLTTLYAAFSEH